MKRWTFRIMLCLLLGAPGALTTVGVAWACVVRHRPITGFYNTRPSAQTPRLERQEWRREWLRSAIGNRVRETERTEALFKELGWLPHEDNDHYEYRVSLYDHASIGVCRQQFLEVQEERNDNAYFVTPSSSMNATAVFYGHRVAAGWPMRALHGMRELTDGQRYDRLLIPFSSHDPVPEHSENVLPLRPIFPGFLVNTLFYAVIWFGLIFGIGALRKAIRRRRGRCVKCGYDLRGTPDDVCGCSECGWGRDS